MNVLQDMILGFQVSLQPINLLYCFFGALIGTLIGVLPGIGPSGTMAILIPVTFHAPPVASIIMLAGIYYGAQYGGSTTSILINIPGEATSVMTCLDGYQMALQGRAGPALGISAFGSFIAGTFAVVGLMLLAPPLSSLALKFGPPEYFSLMLLGLLIIVYIAEKSLIKAIIIAAFGFILSCVGLDVVSGKERFVFNIDELLEGMGIIPIIMGLFGVTEVIGNLEVIVERNLLKADIKGLFPNMKDWADSILAIVRGTIIGFFLGILPGAANLATYISYGVEKKASKHPERFGKGAIAGVAGPESANNSATTAAFVPLLTLGIPATATMAMLFVGFLIHNITPGPLLLQDHPDIFWGVVASMYIGNVILLVLNLPLIGIWVQVTKVPFRFLFPIIVLLCVVGVYSIDNSIFSIWVMIAFGVIGHILRKCDYEPAPLVLAYVLGPMIEQAMRQSLILSHGSFTIFFVRPISRVCLAVGAFLLITSVMKYFRKKPAKNVTMG